MPHEANAFFAIYPALRQLSEAVYELHMLVWDYADSLSDELDRPVAVCEGVLTWAQTVEFFGPDRDPYKTLNRLRKKSKRSIPPALRKARRCADDYRLARLDSEDFLAIKKAIADLKQWLVSEDRQLLESVVDDLRYGSSAFEGFREELAERALGFWGAHFFSRVVNELPDSFFRTKLEYIDTWGDCQQHSINYLDYIPDLLRREFPDSPPQGFPPVELKTVFVPTALQRSVLDALDGKALKKQALADKVLKGEGRALYRPGGIKELVEHGLVARKNGVGFYRPDAPPPGAIPDRG